MIDQSKVREVGLDLSDETAVQEFGTAHGVTRQDVHDAAAVIGPMPNALRAYLASKDRVKAWPAADRESRAQASAAGRQRRRDMEA